MHQSIHAVYLSHYNLWPFASCHHLHATHETCLIASIHVQSRQHIEWFHFRESFSEGLKAVHFFKGFPGLKTALFWLSWKKPPWEPCGLPRARKYEWKGGCCALIQQFLKYFPASRRAWLWITSTSRFLRLNMQCGDDCRHVQLPYNKNLERVNQSIPSMNWYIATLAILSRWDRCHWASTVKFLPYWLHQICFRGLTSW